MLLGSTKTVGVALVVVLTTTQAYAAGAPNRFRERFGLFQPSAVKRAIARAAQSGDAARHDATIRGAISGGLAAGTLSANSALYLTRKIKVAETRGALALELAQTVGSKLTFGQKRDLVLAVQQRGGGDAPATKVA